MNKVCLGKIVKLHGYLGGVKVRTIYDKDFNIKSIKKVYNEKSEEFEVERIFQVKDGVVVQMKNMEKNMSTFSGAFFCFNSDTNFIVV